MRNLKKVLVLVLCFAMILGLMVVGAGAAFTDQDSIDALHQDAVDMCVALNIINGMPDGSFNPTGDVTREQMAKMICILDNGGKEPQGATGTTFSDVAADRWSNKYIESCAARGVVAGVGGGKFDPEGNVTGSQAAKMLLVELGYDQDIAKYTGAGWDTNVNIDATKNGYYDDLEDIDVSAPLSREHAAQMIWNALQAKEVTYSYTLVTNPDGSISSVVTVSNKDARGNDNMTLLEDKYGYDTQLAMVVDVVYDEDDETYTTSFMPMNDDYEINGPVNEFDGDTDYSDLFGMAVQVVYDDNNDPIAVARDESAVLAEGIVNDIDADSVDGDNKITIADKDYKLDSREIELDEEEIITTTDGDMAFLSYLNILGRGGDVFFFDDEMPLYWNIALIDLDGNGKGDHFIVYPAYVGQISYAGAKNITIADAGFDDVDASGSYKIEDNDIFEGADEDNYVLITLGCNTVADTAKGTREDAVITQLTMDTITVTGVKTDSIQADGSWIDCDLFVGSEIQPGPETFFKSGTDYDVATVNGIVVAAEETEDSSNDILFIAALDDFDSALGETKGTVDAKVYFTDGSSDIVTINKLEGKKLIAGADGTTAVTDVGENEEQTSPVAGKMYTYTISGGQYSIKLVTEDNLAGYDSFVPGESGDGSGYIDDPATLSGKKIDDAAVIFVAEAQANGTYSVDVISGEKLKDCSGTMAGNDEEQEYDVNQYSDVLIGKTSGIEYVQVGALICGEDMSPYSTSDTMYGYVVSDPYQTQIKDGDEDEDVWTFDVWTGEKVETLNVKLDDFVAGIEEGAAISYEIEDDLYAVGFEFGTLAAITGFEAKDEGTVLYYECNDDAELHTAILPNDAGGYDMDEDVVFIGISSDDYDDCASITMSNVKVANDEETGVYANAYIFIEDGKIVAIFYDITNEIVPEEGGDAVLYLYAD